MSDDENTLQYEYQRLDSTDGRPSIRLLELLPGSDDEYIESSLFHFKFDECPEYETLSYCWGLVTEKAFISCNGLPFAVTTTLASALPNLRKKDESRMLWIDQICINQQDTDEKTEQVALMRDIYQRSKRTVIWLGEPTETSDLAFNYCEEALKSFFTDKVLDNEALQRLDREEAIIKHIFGRKKENINIQAPTSEEAAALARLMKRPWFSRVWIIQEVGVSDEVVAVCGSKQLDFDLFVLAFCMSVLTSTAMVVGRPLYLHNVLFLSSVREWRGQAVSTLSLSRILDQSRQFNSTDPRDKIFALYGVTSTNLESLVLAPDYSLTSEQVYTQAVFALLKHDGNLNLLEAPRGASTLRATLPSWVPDWSDASTSPTILTERPGPHQPDFGPTRMRSVLQKGFESYYEIDIAELDEDTRKEIFDKVIAQVIDRRIGKDNPTKDPRFTASKNTQIPPPVLEPQGVLRLSGHMVDRITEVGKPLVEPTMDQEQIAALAEDGTTLSGSMRSLRSMMGEVRDFIRIMAEWDDMALKNQPKRYPTGESHDTAYRMTICGGYYPDTVEDAERQYKVWRNALRGTRIVNRMNFMNLKSPGILTLLSTFLGPILTPGYSREFSTMTEVSLRRRLARTAKGYLALLPAETQVGDIVAVLKGGRMPFVLRSRGGPWELIGTGYVHGIMYGEAFDEDSCSEVRLV